MHSFLINMCRSCLTTNVNLKEYIVIEDKEIKCFDAVKIIFPKTVVPVYFGYGYSLCEVCINLLRKSVIFQRRLSQSHYAYKKYMETLNFSNHCKFSILIFQNVNKELTPMVKTDKGSELKHIENTFNQISNNVTSFQDTLNDEYLICDIYNDFDNFLEELDTKLDIKENTLVTISQEESKNMDNIIADSIKKEVVTISDNDEHNEMDFNVTKNALCVKNIKEEQETLIHEGMNRNDKDISIFDNDSCYELVSKIDIKGHIVPWGSIKMNHKNFDPVYVSEKQCKNEILANNLSAIDYMQEISTTFNSEEKTSPILSTKHKEDHRRKPYKFCDCKACFSYASSLIKHKHPKDQHNQSSKDKTSNGSYKWNVCENNCTQNPEVRIRRPYKCDVCEKRFFSNTNLITHKRIHTGEQLYKCDVCERICVREHDLIIHKSIHTGERPYKCDVCKKSFSVISTLNRHKHMHTGERLYKCDVCEKSFTFNSSLVRQTYSYRRTTLHM